MTATGGGSDALLRQMLDDVRRLVTVETPSSDLAAVREGAGIVAALGERLLGRAPQLREVDGVTHVLWPARNPDRPVLLLGHQDTVWPHGTLTRLPFAIDGDLLRGPGTFDMKVGVVQMLHAASALVPELLDRVTILVTGDEEVGSTTSRPLIEEMARASVAALVAEGAADGGAHKIARKGASILYLEAHGVAAHAGLEPWRGGNATVAIAACVAEIVALSRDSVGTTVTPTVIEGGSSLNTVPDRARLGVDVRAWSADEQQRVEDAVRALDSGVPGTRLSVTVDHSPPMEAAMSRDVAVLARRVADELDMVLPEGASVGGASDANFVAGVGTPTLDGLGAVGGGAHADDEHAVISEIVPRTKLLTGLLRGVLA